MKKSDQVALQPFRRCSKGSYIASKPAIDGVNRLATSAYKPPRLVKSSLLGLSRRVGQTYPLVADQVALQPYLRCSAARHCEIRPPTCKNLLSSDFCSGR